jgi:hypothetical protein
MDDVVLLYLELILGKLTISYISQENNSSKRMLLNYIPTIDDSERI